MKWFLTFIIAGCLLVLGASTANAEAALELRPLQYVETLQKGERKQGMIDIHNTEPYPVAVRLSVQGFRQIDTEGHLEFFDDQQLREGITLDVQSTDIPAYKTLRLYFTTDSTKLPTGDLFAAIFAEAVPTDHEGSGATVRLGSLLMLTNQTPGARQAKIAKLDMNWLQVGDGLRGSAVIANDAPKDTASGYFPEVSLRTWPFGPTDTHSGPLVQAGNQRTVQLRQAADLIGVYKVRVATGNSYREQWVVAVTGYWRWLSIVIVVAGVALGVFYIWWYRGKKLALKR